MADKAHDKPKANGKEDGKDPTERPRGNMVPDTILQPALLHEGLLSIMDNPRLPNELRSRLTDLLGAAATVFTQAHSVFRFAEQLVPQANWGEWLKLLEGDRKIMNPLIFEAFSTVRRHDFLWENYFLDGLLDKALPIPGEQTISQPTLVAQMLDALELEKGQKILDIGSGSGYTTALMAHITGEEGSVTGKEVLEELVAFGRDNLAKYAYPWARIDAANSHLGDPVNAPFDRILVSAKLERRILPLLIEQLNPDGGILVVPVVDHDADEQLASVGFDQVVLKITRHGNEHKEEIVAEGTGFVPIVFTPVNGQATFLAKRAISGKLKS